MRLIDADKLVEKTTNLEAVALEQVAKLEPCEEHEKWKVWSAILNERSAFKFDLFDAPTVEAVEVVRCKDCKFNYANQIPSKNACQLCVELPISDEFYCAYGEREEDADT